VHIVEHWRLGYGLEGVSATRGRWALFRSMHYEHLLISQRAAAAAAVMFSAYSSSFLLSFF